MLEIRPAREDDGESLTQIEGECCSEPPWLPSDFLKRATVIAELDRKPVGFLVLQDVFTGGEEPVYVDSSATIASEVREREILNLAVLPLYRRLGIARALLASEMQHPAIYYLEVRESNEAARRLYESSGFVEIGRRHHFYSSPDETGIVMKASVPQIQDSNL